MLTLPNGCQPVKASGNSNERFLISSAYSPPSAAKLMSSKNMPYIAGFTEATGLEMSIVKLYCCSGFCAMAIKDMDNVAVKIMFFNFMAFIFGLLYQVLPG